LENRKGFQNQATVVWVASPDRGRHPSFALFIFAMKCLPYASLLCVCIAGREAEGRRADRGIWLRGHEIPLLRPLPAAHRWCSLSIGLLLIQEV